VASSVTHEGSYLEVIPAGSAGKAESFLMGWQRGHGVVIEERLLNWFIVKHPPISIEMLAEMVLLLQRPVRVVNKNPEQRQEYDALRMTVRKINNAN